jgi:hypothetical protein
MNCSYESSCSGADGSSAGTTFVLVLRTGASPPAFKAVSAAVSSSRVSRSQRPSSVPPSNCESAASIRRVRASLTASRSSSSTVTIPGADRLPSGRRTRAKVGSSFAVNWNLTIPSLPPSMRCSADASGIASRFKSSIRSRTGSAPAGGNQISVSNRQVKWPGKRRSSSASGRSSSGSAD